MSNELILYIVIGWLVGFIGGLGVIFTDYKSYSRDVYLWEFLFDILLTFLLWPVIIHWIIIYPVLTVSRWFGWDFKKLKNIKIIKGRKV